jgi:serine/threonine protein kinase
MKTPESMERLEELFHEAAGLDPQQRADFMTRLRAASPELGAAVESLIAAHERPDSFIDSPAYELGDSITTPPPALVAGQLVGHYQIVRPLGKGGMGEVYLADDTKLDRKVALKLLPAEYTNHKERLRRFIQEAKAASSLNHPNIITIHEIGQEEGAHFIATEFIDGQTLKQLMIYTKMTLPEILDIAMQTANALQAAHAAGIVHRDIKPDNIMVRPDGYVKVLDFGLAKLTEKSRQSSLTPADSELDTMVKEHTLPGTVMGTINYMSPEQARGQVLDPRTDIFSLGVVLYQMASGHIPFAGATNADTLVSILGKEPVPLDEYAPDIPAEFQRIVSKALRKDREERYQTTRDLLIDLKSLKEELAFAQKLERSRPPRTTRHPAGTTSPSASETVDEKAATTTVGTAIARQPVQPAANRNQRVLIFVLVAVVLGGLTVGGVALWRRRGASPITNPSVPSVPAMQRTLTYWIAVQKYRYGKPFEKSFRLSDDINFEKDYRIRLNISSAQTGRLYLLNEGPPEADRTPTFNVLFPSTTANNSSALLKENQQIQIPRESWFQFDEQQGTERIWLVWADKDVPELEAVKGFANPSDRGVISSPGLRMAVSQFLKAHLSSAPSVERDQDKKETTVRANSEILVHIIKLEHH